MTCRYCIYRLPLRHGDKCMRHDKPLPESKTCGGFHAIDQSRMYDAIYVLKTTAERERRCNE